MSQGEFRQHLIDQMMDVNKIEVEFSKLHCLIDNLFQNEADLAQQNSCLFHLKLALVLSAMVQMKNTLVKFMDYEINEQNPNLNWNTTPLPRVINFEEATTQDYDLSVLTPETCPDPKQYEATSKAEPRNRLHMFVIHDDSAYQDYLLNTIRAKALKIVDLPSLYDSTSLVPFLLLNDHCILRVRNPKKDLLPILKSIIRHGIIFYKPAAGQPRPLHVNITVWVFYDIVPLLDKAN